MDRSYRLLDGRSGDDRDHVLLASAPECAATRYHAERLLLMLLKPRSGPTVQLRLPVDDRARRVADAVLANPADSRTLDAWGDVVGASARTLARHFLADTELSFPDWRHAARMQCALAMLSDGAAVSGVARSTGYASASSFVAAFRRSFGETPGSAKRRRDVTLS